MENVSENPTSADKSGHEDLPTGQEVAIMALLGGANQKQAAQQAGVTDRTLRRWLLDPVFLSALREARAAQWTESTSLLQSATREAVETLQRVMRGGDNETARVTASRVLLDRAIKAVEVDDLAARLADFEARLEAVASSNADQHSRAG